MLNQVFTTKIRQSQEFVNSKRIPVTILSLPKQVVVGLRSQETDKYTALQVAVGQKNLSPKKPQLKPLKQASLEKRPRWTREIRSDQTEEVLAVGDELPITDILHEGDTVKVTGVSKGKGFSGGMKRHGFAGGPRTHGQSDRARAPGSIGRGTTPGRVVKGKKMAGRLGGRTTTIAGLKILKLDLNEKQITLSGLVPGSKDKLLRLTVTKQSTAGH